MQSAESLTTTPMKVKFGPLLKLISHERKEMERFLQANAVKSGSFVDRYLLQVPPAEP